MKTEFIMHLNEIVWKISKAKENAERMGCMPRYKAVVLLLDCINSGLEEGNYKKCDCGNWHEEEEGVFCIDCKYFGDSTSSKIGLRGLENNK